MHKNHLQKRNVKNKNFIIVKIIKMKFVKFLLIFIVNMATEIEVNSVISASEFCGRKICHDQREVFFQHNKL